MKKNSIILSETQLHDMIKESVKKVINEYATGAEYDSSAPWREGEREPDVDPRDAEIEDMWRRAEDGDYDGFEIMDENGEIRARVMAKDFPYPGDQKAFLQTLEMAKEIAAKEDIDVEVFGIFDGYTSDELVNDGGFPYDFLWASDYGFCKDKKLPVKMNESKKTVKLNESQIKEMIKESVKSVLNELASVRAVDGLRNMIIGEIDYLYNEGVVDYDDEHLEAMASGEIEPDYMDIARATYEDCKGGQSANPETLEMLKSFISGNPEHRSVIINTIDDAIDYFVG